MSKFIFWLYMFIVAMILFLKYEIGSFADIPNGAMSLMNIILTIIVAMVVYYGTPNGFIKGLKNMRKDKHANK
jgi:hypothetical protein